MSRPTATASQEPGRVQLKVMSLPLSSFLFLFIFRQERAGSSERSEKPDKRKDKE
jgi:hypothetical protein